MKLRPITVMAGLAAVALGAAGLIAWRGDGGGQVVQPMALPIVVGPSARATATTMAGALSAAGPVTYVAGPDLAPLDGSASAWRVSSARPTEAEVARLAAALGLTAAPTATADGGWSVSGNDTVLVVSRITGLGGWVWSYSPEATIAGGTSSSPVTTVPGDMSSDLCRPPATTIPPGPSRGSGGAPGAVSTCGSTAPTPPVGVPDEAAAESAARTLWSHAGFDTTGWKVTSTADEWSAQVTAAPVLDGTPVEGLDLTVSFGGQGAIEQASGWFGVPAPADTYPLMGTTKAIAELNAGHTVGGIEPMMATATAPPTTYAPAVDDLQRRPPPTTRCPVDEGCVPCPATASCSPPVTAPVTVEPLGPTVTYAPVTITIDRAELVLVAEPGTDGAAWLVPAYRLSSSATGGSWTVLAVDQSYIAPAGPPTTGRSSATTPGSSVANSGSVAPPSAPDGLGAGPGPGPAVTTTSVTSQPPLKL